jgi:peroxiredoxin
MRDLLLRVRRLVLPFALAFAAVITLALARENRSLMQAARHLRGQQRLPHARDVVPPVRAPRLDGDSVTLGAGPTAVQVLFVFTTTCPYCIETLPAWEQIATRLSKTSDVVLYGVSLDADSATRPYVAAHQLTFPIVRFPSQRAAAWYRALGGPLTLAIDSTGRILYARAGVLTPAAQDSLFAALSGGHADGRPVFIPITGGRNVWQDQVGCPYAVRARHHGRPRPRRTAGRRRQPSAGPVRLPERRARGFTVR